MEIQRREAVRGFVEESPEQRDQRLLSAKLSKLPDEDRARAIEAVGTFMGIIEDPGVRSVAMSGFLSRYKPGADLRDFQDQLLSYADDFNHLKVRLGYRPLPGMPR